MARPKRTERQLMFDEFADMPLEDQAAALAIMQEIHRQARRVKVRTAASALERGQEE